MADNVPITAGAGTTVSTEEVTTLNGGAVAAQHVQRIAAALRTADGAAIDLPGNATDGLLVNLGANNDVTVGAALPAGTNNIGDVDVLSIAAGSNAIGDVGVIARTAGGTSLPYAFLSTAAVQAAAIKASAGQVFALHFFNVGAAAVYVRLYNMTTTPATTDTPVYRAIIPGNTAGAGFVVPIPPGVEFGTGIGIRVTGAVADNDATVLAANQVIGNVFYK